MTTSTAPLSPGSLNPEPRSLNPRWTPDGDAHIIFQWVKMEGKSQSWVAAAFGINQSTVSRIIQRYERWQAHAKERENGRLDQAERLRAQRWLTYERNEQILASCLRIAQEMEGFIDTSRSTIHRPVSSSSQQHEVRAQHATIDRTGMVARFLRLAFRINMEQLKLAELAEPPSAEPLSPDELAAEEAQAAADAEELAEARRRGREKARRRAEEEGWGPRTKETGDSGQEPLGCAPPTEEPDRKVHERSGMHLPGDEDRCISSAADSCTLHHSPAPLHNLHNENVPEIAASSSESCTCVLQARVGINSPGVCITDCNPPPPSTNVVPSSDNPSGATAAAS